jgi:hypothetical protein
MDTVVLMMINEKFVYFYSVQDMNHNVGFLWSYSYVFYDDVHILLYDVDDDDGVVDDDDDVDVQNEYVH